MTLRTTFTLQESAGTPGGAAVDIKQEPPAENGDLDAAGDAKTDLALEMKSEGVYFGRYSDATGDLLPFPSRLSL